LAKNFEGRRSSYLNLDQSAKSLAKTFPNLLEIWWYPCLTSRWHKTFRGYWQGFLRHDAWGKRRARSYYRMYYWRQRGSS
jgi:hypothetical protein